MNHQLNERAFRRIDAVRAQTADLKIEEHRLSNGGSVFDFGIEAEGGLQAGLKLAQVCLADLGTIALIEGDIDRMRWPFVHVSTDHPVSACLLSQYAGWQISLDRFFAMGSGPMRAAAAREELFEKLSYQESASRCVGVLEGGQLPDEAVVEFIAERTHVAPDHVTLAIAPTSSQAGSLQVVARSVETALHKLFELGFDMSRIVSGWGTAPLPPVAADDLSGIGRTNDAILYGGCVTLWVRGDDASLEEIGPQVPASASESYGKPFLQIFEEAGRDFYQIDPHLFSPAEITFQNLDTGNVHRFGRLAPDVLRTSFGM